MSDAGKAACIIGWPAAHSRSPLIHNYWIKQYNLDAEYRREAVPPEQFDDFVETLRDHGYIGAMSRCRTSRPRWRYHCRTSAPAPSAPPIRCGTTTTRCAPPTPTW